MKLKTNSHEIKPFTWPRIISESFPNSTDSITEQDYMICKKLIERSTLIINVKVLYQMYYECYFLMNIQKINSAAASKLHEAKWKLLHKLPCY